MRQVRSRWQFPHATRLLLVGSLVGLAGCPSNTIVSNNTVPEVTLYAPAVGTAIEADTAFAVACQASDEETLPEELIVTWSATEQVLGGARIELLSGAPDSDGQYASTVAAGLPEGEWLIEVEVTDEGGLAAAASVEVVVQAPNGPPQVQISAPLDGATLVEGELQFSATVIDDRDNVGLEVRWESDVVGLLFSDLTDDFGVTSFTTELLRPGTHQITATVTDDGGEIDTDSIQVTVESDNQPPGIAAVGLGPEPAFETSELSCTPTGWFDPDGDPPGYRYQWTRNTSLISGAESSTLTGADFDEGDTITCIAVPFDGREEGTSIESNAVLIENSPPGPPEIIIEPADPGPGEDLFCVVSTEPTDPDELDELTIEFAWLRNGAPASLTGDVVTSDLIALGDEWECQARAHDEATVSEWAYASAVVLPHEGDIIISELMVEPAAVPALRGEWVELHNTTDVAIDLFGFELSDSAGDFHQIGTSLVIEPGGYRVLGLNSDPLLNGGVALDYQYESIELDDAFDELELSFQEVLVDAVAWNLDYTLHAGRSLSLDPGLLDHMSNDLSASWCGAMSALSLGDHATPGVGNDPCDCYWSDGDFDVFGTDVSCAAIDCDDGDPAINPAAIDICEDGVDSDCDGADLLCVCEETDLDGDGFGTSITCPEIDCDDDNATVWPGAAETCDGLDQDCDGLIDEGATDDRRYWRDLDGDGYGGTLLSGFYCTPPDGWVDNDDDCSDGDPTRNPGAAEICDDEIDQDCDGVPDNGCFYLDYGQTDELLLGGGGGTTSSVDSCPTGYVVVGLNIREDGVAVHGFQLECRRLFGDGTLGSAWTSSMRGTGAGGLNEGDCPDGELLVGQVGTGVSGGLGILKSAGGRCTPLENIVDATGGWETAFGPWGSADGASFNDTCRSGYVVTGAEVHWALAVHRLGLRCTALETY